MILHRWFSLQLLASLLWLVLAALLPRPAAAQQSGPIYTVQVEGVVTSITVDYLRRALQQAEASTATALIIQLSSEGTVLRAIRPFVHELAEADVPVVVYVAPPGTNAGSAGAFLLSAAHVSAMAPNTSFGTAVPLADVDTLLTEQTRNLLLAEVSDQLRNWNTERNRNADWVDRAVREGLILTNEQAAGTTPPTVDLIASDQAELLTLLEGRVVTLENGQQVEIETLGRTTTAIEPTLWEEFLLILADPTVAFLLLVMAAIAIYGELLTPGVGVLAGIGIVLLIAALAGMLVLPIRWISLVGLLLAFVLVGLDLYASSHGVLTVSGLALLIVSSLTLIDTSQAPGTSVAFWAVGVVSFLVAGFAATGIWLVIRTRKRPVETGQESLVGRIAEVRKRLEPEGLVFIEGALWRAVSEDGDVEPGDWVRVTAVYNLRLAVRRIETTSDDIA